MSSDPKVRMDWRQLILEVCGVIAGMLFVTNPEEIRECRIHAREPRRAEIEQWLRNQK